MKITKAVIPAAGLGTRMLPIAKAVPKEMIPIVDKPALQYIVEEAVASGITDILIITNRGKGAIEDYFDLSPEYEARLEASGKIEQLESIRKIADMANIYFLRQKRTMGLGHAVGTARSFVGNEPFAVLYGDDVILSDKPVCRQLMDAYDRYGLAVAGVNAVAPEMIGRYCSLGVEPLEDGIMRVTDMVEKPKPEEVLSLYSILGRVLLTPDIFDILEHTAPGAGGEIQLTDAMRTLTREKGMTAVDFEGRRYDMGSKLGFLTASIEVGLRHPETAEGLKEYLHNLAAML